MSIINRRFAVLIGICLYCLTGCAASTNFNERGHPPPDHWLVDGAHESTGCPSIDGNYKNWGVGRLASHEPIIEMRLDAVLGYAFPSLELPTQVSFLLDEESDVITFHFSGLVNETFSRPVSCSNGWYTWETTMSNHYVGDGANLDYSIRNIKLGVAKGGDLVVHLKLDTQLSSFAIFRSRQIREIWSKFKLLQDEN